MLSLYAAIYGLFVLAGHGVLKRSKVMRLYALGCVFKLVLHVLSCLQLIPIVGVSPPLVTWSATEYAAIGLILGDAVQDRGN
jgi:hypothetical protein